MGDITKARISINFTIGTPKYFYIIKGEVEQSWGNNIIKQTT